MTHEEEHRLWQVYKRLDNGEWPEDVLGEMPANLSPALVRINAAESIEQILGEARLSAFHHVDNLGKTENEWLRWYTVDRFRYGEVRHKERGCGHWLLIGVTAAILTATLILAMRSLSGS